MSKLDNFAVCIGLPLLQLLIMAVSASNPNQEEQQ